MSQSLGEEEKIMKLTLAPAKKPRCVFMYAIAPAGFNPAKANTAVNTLIARKDIPLCVYHDHFIGQPGGIGIFDIRDLAEVDGLVKACAEELNEWNVDIRPLIFSHNPGALDEQIRYTLSAYGGTDWNVLKQENRPSYNTSEEANSASDE